MMKFVAQTIKSDKKCLTRAQFRVNTKKNDLKQLSKPYKKIKDTSSTNIIYRILVWWFRVKKAVVVSLDLFNG